MELIGHLALGSVKGSKQKKKYCDNFAESAHVRVGAAGAPVFIFIFPLELLVASRIVAAFAKLTKGSWIYRVFMEIGCSLQVLLCWPYYGVFCNAILALLVQRQIVYVVSVALVQTFR